MMAPIVLVLARANDGTIGHQGSIPWRIPADMRHFKAVTMGKPCIMGRKTWESLPKKPLPGRTNIVVTRERGFRAEGAAVAHSFADAVARAQTEDPGEIAVIGGAHIYREAMSYATRIYLSEIHADFGGDVRMPFDRGTWEEISREDHAGESGAPGFSFVTLERQDKIGQST